MTDLISDSLKYSERFWMGTEPASWLRVAAPARLHPDARSAPAVRGRCCWDGSGTLGFIAWFL